MTQRINFSHQAPQLTKKLVELGVLLHEGTLGNTLIDLVNIRASQLNGCSLCLDMHVKEAKIHGERELRLHHIAAWRESTLFDDKERAVLEWTELLTRLPEHGVGDPAYQRLRAVFSEKELSELTFAVMAINAWNRVNVAFRSVPGSLDKVYGLDKANLA